MEMTIKELELAHKRSLPNYKPSELFQIFPEAAQVINDKIAELKDDEAGILNEMQERISAVQALNPTPDEYEVAREIINTIFTDQLLSTRKNLKRVTRFSKVLAGRPSGLLDDEDVYTADQVPIDQLVDTPVRRQGQRGYTLCPIHHEKTPSFTIYYEDNSWHCYGCNVGGGAIDLVMKRYTLPFRDAVKYLLG